MRKFLLLGLVLCCSAAMATGSHAVKGYYKKDGTYVAPTQATNPNDTKTDNYGSKGNVNPYSGKEGTKDPYAVEKPRSRKK